ncbi:MAG: Ig-like domain-containing protein, partial [Chloroflexota bacterium]|nr:Ig-like domain-containing protein [Chloroflexota bacterium]
TLLFTPAGALAPSSAYTITIGTATTAAGAPITAPVSARFSTAPPAGILRTLPAPDARNVITDTLISVQFTRPMIPLTALDAQPDVSRWVSIQPAVAGRFVWLGTATLGFRPTAGFLPSTTYRVAVQTGLPDAAGVGISQGLQWQFTTIQPDLISVSPPNGAGNVDLDAPLVLGFNQPMDHASVEAALRVSDVQGRFSWSPASDVVTYTPASLLPFSKTLNVHLEGSLKPAQGEAVAADPKTQAWTFRTVEQTHRIASEPASDRENAPGSNVAVSFNNGLAAGQDFGSLITIEPRPTGFLGQWQVEPEGRVVMTDHVTLAPDTTYRFTIKAGLKDRYGALVKAESWTAKVGPPPPDIRLLGGEFQPVVADAPVRLRVEAPNLDSFTLNLYQLNESDMRSLIRDYKQQVPGSRKRSWTIQVPGGKGPAKAFTIPVAPDGVSDRLPAGYWVLEATAPAPSYMGPEPLRDYVVFVAGHTGLTMKQDGDNLLVWAVDYGSGKAKANYPLRAVLWGESGSNPPSVTGTTGADGVARLKLPLPDQTHNYSSAVFSGSPNDTALVVSSWGQGIQPYDFGLSGSYYNGQPSAGQYRAAVYTDRPIYRPDQKVYFRGVVRLDDDVRYSLPQAGATVHIQVHANAKGDQTIYDGTATVSPAGTFDGEFLLPKDAPTGSYNLMFSAPNEPMQAQNLGSAYFSVEEYRKPDFQVSVNPAHPSAISGDPLTATVATSYYFGGPVAGVTTTLNLQAGPYYFYWSDPATNETWSFNDYEDQWWSYNRGPSNNEPAWSKTYQARTGADGTLTVDLSSPITTTDHSKVVSVEAQVQDLSNQTVAGRGSAVIHQGQYYVGVAAAVELATARQPITISLRTIAPDDNATTGGRVQPNTAVHVRYIRSEWKRVPLEGTPYGYDWQPDDKLVGEADATTDAQGRATLLFTPPQGGNYRIEATSTDARGHALKSRTSLWVSDPDAGNVSWRTDNPNALKLVADKKQYQVGDTAHILVTSPFTQATGLLTVERGHLRRVQVVDLRGGAPTVDVPLLDGDLPNVYIGLTLIGFDPAAPDAATKAPQPLIPVMKQGFVNLTLDTSSQKLTVSIEPQGKTFKPGSSAPVVIHTRDKDGQGQPARVSLAVVDEAIYALAGDNTADLLGTFYGERGLSVGTASSYTAGGVGLPVRHGYVNGRNNEMPKTGGDAGGDLAPAAPSAAGAARSTVAQAESKALDNNAPAKIRTDFRDTAFWQAEITTDASGTATVQVPLPDNLTTWRLSSQAAGAAAQLHVGAGSVPLTVTQPLLLRPVAPRFLVVGDQAAPQAIIRNGTAGPLTVEVDLTVSGAAAYSMNRESTRTLTIPAGEQAVETWAILVSSGVTTTLHYTVRATAGLPAGETALSDAIDVTIPVHPLVAPEAVATSGEVGDSATETIFLPYGINPQLGELVVSIAPSLAAGTVDGIRYVQAFPYECTEQTVSRFLPLITLDKVYADQGVATPFRTELPDIMAHALTRLTELQRPDGGWGWWENDLTSNPFLTAYALQGLAAARDAGYKPDVEQMQRGRARLLQFLNESAPTGLDQQYNNNQRAYMLYVLTLLNADAAKADAGDQPDRILAQQARLSNHAAAWLAIALHRLGRDSDARALLDRLTAAAKQTSTLAHWEEDTIDYYMMGTDTRATALALDALVQIAPQDALIPKTVRWLMSASREGHWLSTQDTAITLIGLADYMRASKELSADYAWDVQLFGKALGSGTANRSTLTQTVTLTAPVSQMPQNVAGPLTITRTNQSGKLYYHASLRYYLPGQGIKARSEGLAISRQYYRMPVPGSGGQPERTDHITAGDLVKVRLSLVVPDTSYYLMVEDPLPAGLEAVNGSLNTTADSERPPNPQGTVGAAGDEGSSTAVAPSSVRGGIFEPYFPWWRYWGPFSRVEVRDDRVALFADSVGPGTYSYEYFARATTPGTYMAQPAQAKLLYFPDVFGRSDGGTFTVDVK